MARKSPPAAEQMIPDTDEAWDNRELGADEAYVKVDASAEALNNRIDGSLDLKAISIRLPISLIEDFKIIAELNGLGYQTLMKQILKRFAECEKKRILRELGCKVRAERQRSEAELDEPSKKTQAA